MVVKIMRFIVLFVNISTICLLIAVILLSISLILLYIASILLSIRSISTFNLSNASTWRFLAMTKSNLTLVYGWCDTIVVKLLAKILKQVTKKNFICTSYKYLRIFIDKDYLLKEFWNENNGRVILEVQR